MKRACIHCGWSQKTITQSQQDGVSTIRCVNGRSKHRFAEAPTSWKLIEELRFLMESGFTTREIEADLGIKYGSILTSLNRYEHKEELAALKSRRAREWEVRQQTEITILDRPRCAHGAWSSSGQCEHGRMGRKPAA